MVAIKYDMIADYTPDRIVVIDTETTGLDPDNNEVLSLAIVDIDGNELFSSLIKPARRKRWPKAQEIHGIAPADVMDAPTLAECSDDLARYFDGSHLVVGYNVTFDIGMLKASGLKVAPLKTFDVMKEAEIINGDRRKLSECAVMFGYDDDHDAHDALSDAKATAFCFKRLMDSEDYRKAKEYQALGLSKNDARMAVAQSSVGCLLPIVAAAASAAIAIVATIL